MCECEWFFFLFICGCVLANVRKKRSRVPGALLGSGPTKCVQCACQLGWRRRESEAATGSEGGLISLEEVLKLDLA